MNQRNEDEPSIEWLRRAVAQAEKSVAEGKVHSLEEVEARLAAARRDILRRRAEK